MPPGDRFPPGPPPGEHRLRRSTRHKVLAGVAGGLGEYTGVDPVLFRVLFAVLSLFGGTGVLLYVIGWLFLPADDQPASPVESLIGRGSASGSSRARDAATAAILVVVGLLLAGVLARGDAGDVVLLLVVVGGGYVVLRNLAERREGGPPRPAAAPPPAVPYQAFEPVPGYQPTATATVAPPAPAQPGPKKERSILGAATVSLLLLVLGVTAALDAGGAVHPAPEDYLAVAVGVLGLGLLVGAWYGRARSLIWLGLPLVLALIVIGTSGVSLKGGAGDRSYTPRRAAEIQDEYRVGVGSLRLDLTAVDFSEQLVRTKLSAGVGNVEVLLPPDVDVSIDGRAGIGEVDLLGRKENGTSSTRSVVDYGSAGDGSIDLVLDLDVNIGRVEVDRA